MPRALSYTGVPLSLAHLCELESAPHALIELAAGAGFASVGLRTHRASAGGLEYPGTSNINWSGAGQITANFAIAATNVHGEITVHAGGNGSTNVIVDVTGYYR